MRTSVSKLTSVARCGLAYELERIDKKPPLPAGWTIQGIAVHEAVDRWEKSGRQMPVEDAKKIFRSAWRKEIKEADERFPRDRWLVGGRKKVQKDLEDRYYAGMDQVEKYIEYNLNDTDLTPYRMPDGSVAAEVGFEVTYGDVAVIGYIDLILQSTKTGELVVRDTKSGSKAPSVPFQLVVYARAVEELIGERVRWGHYFMTRDGKPTPPVDLTTLDHGLIETWFRRQVAIVEQGLYLPDPGDYCRTCPMSPHCPLVGGR